MIDFHHKEPYNGNICHAGNGLMPTKRNAQNVSGLLTIVRLFVNGIDQLQRNTGGEYPKQKEEGKIPNGVSGETKRLIGVAAKCLKSYCCDVLGNTRNGAEKFLSEITILANIVEITRAEIWKQTILKASLFIRNIDFGLAME